MDYETLDKIADSYIPLLAIVFLMGWIGCAIKLPGERVRLLRVFIFALCLLVVSYGGMFFDNALHVWPFFGLDYSTHTAVSLSLVLGLCVLAPRFWMLAASSFVAYALLMLYQNYHSLADIISTAVLPGGAGFLLERLLVSPVRKFERYSIDT